MVGHSRGLSIRSIGKLTKRRSSNAQRAAWDALLLANMISRTSCDFLEPFIYSVAFAE